MNQKKVASRRPPRFVFQVPPELHKSIRMRTTELNTTASEVIENLVRQWLNDAPTPDSANLNAQILEMDKSGSAQWTNSPTRFSVTVSDDLLYNIRLRTTELELPYSAVMIPLLRNWLSKHEKPMQKMQSSGEKEHALEQSNYASNSHDEVRPNDWPSENQDKPEATDWFRSGLKAGSFSEWGQDAEEKLPDSSILDQISKLLERRWP